MYVKKRDLPLRRRNLWTLTGVEFVLYAITGPFDWISYLDVYMLFQLCYSLGPRLHHFSSHHRRRRRKNRRPLYPHSSSALGNTRSRARETSSSSSPPRKAVRNLLLICPMSCFIPLPGNNKSLTMLLAVTWCVTKCLWQTKKLQQI